MCEPYYLQTADQIKELPIVLAVGDTSYLDYKKIVEKREEYGPIGNGGNGLILHSALAVNADNGQPMGLLWSKLWHREHQEKTVKKTKKQKQKQRAEARKRPIEEKESYKWIEAFQEVQNLLSSEQLSTISSKIIHVFDREGDMAEVFQFVSQTGNTAANIAEKKGAIELLEKIKAKFPRLEKIFADGGYQGQDFHQRVQDDYNLDLEVVKRTQSKGFKVLPWRWIVERTFAWLLRYRRLTIDYEVLPETAEAFIHVAMIRIMVRRLA